MSKTPRVDAYMAANYSDAVFGHHLADFARQLDAENAELRADAERWRFARDWLAVEDFDELAYEMRGHIPSETESKKTDEACDRARALLAKVEGK